MDVRQPPIETLHPLCEVSKTKASRKVEDFDISRRERIHRGSKLCGEEVTMAVSRCIWPKKLNAAYVQEEKAAKARCMGHTQSSRSRSSLVVLLLPLSQPTPEEATPFHLSTLLFLTNWY